LEDGLDVLEVNVQSDPVGEQSGTLCNVNCEARRWRNGLVYSATFNMQGQTCKQIEDIRCGE
jgi:hypothetical protein